MLNKGSENSAKGEVLCVSEKDFVYSEPSFRKNHLEDFCIVDWLQVEMVVERPFRRL